MDYTKKNRSVQNTKQLKLLKPPRHRYIEKTTHLLNWIGTTRIINLIVPSQSAEDVPQVQPVHIIIKPLDSNLLPVVVLLQVALQRFGELQLVYVVIRQSADYGRPAQMLQREREVPVQRPRQHRLEEHAAARIFVVLDETADRVRREDVGIVRIEAELVVPLLDASVEGASVLAERHREEEFFLGGVAEEEGALGFAVEEAFRLVSVHLTWGR